jgi:hypothetical protein
MNHDERFSTDYYFHEFIVLVQIAKIKPSVTASMCYTEIVLESQ